MGPPSAICAPAASLAAAPANFVQINPEALYPVAFGLFSHALRIARTRGFSYLSLIFGEWDDLEVAEAGLATPAGEIGTRVVESVAEFYQHVEDISRPNAFSRRASSI